jgi:hypothetical protein
VAKISVRRRIRPIRFAFLVGHEDADAFRKAVQLNTVLWGGMFNAIIPVFDVTPESWAKEQTPDQIVRGYLDAFEPDFVVTASGIDAEQFGVAPYAKADLDEMLTTNGFVARGLSMMDVYRWLHRNQPRLMHRAPPALRHPKPIDPALSLLAAAVFGDYPGAPLGYFEVGFRELGGEETQLDVGSYRSSLRDERSPLSLGLEGLDDVGFSGPRRTFLLVDPTRPGDLIDFWNLRAVGWRVVAVPIGWSQAFAAEVVAAMQDAGELDAQHAAFFRPCVMTARSVSQPALEGFVAAIHQVNATLVVTRSWMPRIWEDRARDADHATRIDVWAGDSRIDAEINGDWLSFRAAGPPFAEDWWGGQPRFACVVELRSYDMPELAQVIPADIGDLDALLRWAGPAHMLRVGTEGLALLADRKDVGVTWSVPEGFRVFAEWLRPKGTVALSSAGKVAQRFISILGGPEHTRLVMEVAVIEALADAARSPSHDIPYGQLSGLLKQSLGKRQELVDRRIAEMVRRKVLKLGLRLQCETCSRHDWFPLDGLREQLTCMFCLSEMPFPCAKPPKNPCWSYRPLGPFAVDDHANGAHAVAAAIRTLRGFNSNAETTWIPSFTLTNGSLALEADFAMLWKAIGPLRGCPSLILGECKTFKRFLPEDIERMRSLARLFPDSVLVFATLNDELLESERDLIAPFAIECREGWRNPVVVLTARELATDDNPPYCWQRTKVEAETKMFEAMRNAPGASFRRLADATQQLRLGMEPDAGWPHREAR